MIRTIAEKLHKVTAFFLFDIEEETEETKTFSKRFNYLLDKYKLEKADDPDIYEGDLSEWEEPQLLSFAKELDILLVKYDNLLSTGSPIVNSGNDENEELLETFEDGEEEEILEDQEEEIDENLRKGQAYREIAEAGKARAMEEYLKNQENSENDSDE